MTTPARAKRAVDALIRRSLAGEDVEIGDDDPAVIAALGELGASAPVRAGGRRYLRFEGVESGVRWTVLVSRRAGTPSKPDAARHPVAARLSDGEAERWLRLRKTASAREIVVAGLQAIEERETAGG